MEEQTKINPLTASANTATSNVDIKALSEKIQKESAFVDLLTMEMSKVIIGQAHMTESLLIGLLSNGHILLEGVPGLAKTLAITTLAKTVDAKFSRVQFTPDLLPADVVGTMIYNQKQEAFTVKQGPIFANFVLADEINRAPAKVQSALLEAMQERQITIGDETFKLQEPFLVMGIFCLKVYQVWQKLWLLTLYLKLYKLLLVECNLHQIYYLQMLLEP